MAPFSRGLMLFRNAIKPQGWEPFQFPTRNSPLSVALDNFLKAAHHSDRSGLLPAPRFAHGAETALPDGRTLVCSFHPSRRNTNTGLLTRPMWHGIFRRARELVGSAPARTRRSRAAVTAVE